MDRTPDLDLFRALGAALGATLDPARPRAAVGPRPDSTRPDSTWPGPTWSRMDLHARLPRATHPQPSLPRPSRPRPGLPPLLPPGF